MNMQENVIAWLFETKALCVCPNDLPFWYSSGAIGPYYINTHFLYGNESKANELLDIIEEQRDDAIALLECITAHIKANFTMDKIFFNFIHAMKEFVHHHIPIDEIDFISGGERRDWFFSIMLAELLQKPHIAIFKDHRAFINTGMRYKEIQQNDFCEMKGLHVADLINEGSSYSRAWVPSLRSLGGKMKWSLAGVDRKQGGEETLHTLGVKSFAMLEISRNMFQAAKDLHYISDDQFQMIVEYINHPRESMEHFLRTNPQFLKHALVSDEKTRRRAQYCIDAKIYGDLRNMI